MSHSCDELIDEGDNGDAGKVDPLAPCEFE